MIIALHAGLIILKIKTRNLFLQVSLLVNILPKDKPDAVVMIKMNSANSVTVQHILYQMHLLADQEKHAAIWIQIARMLMEHVNLKMIATVFLRMLKENKHTAKIQNG